MRHTGAVKPGSGGLSSGAGRMLWMQVTSGAPSLFNTLVLYREGLSGRWRCGDECPRNGGIGIIIFQVEITAKRIAARIVDRGEK